MNLRDEYRPLIARIIADNRGQALEDLRRILRDAFPHPPRRYHPYAVWLDEIAHQLKNAPPHDPTAPRPHKPAANQTALF